MSCVARVVERVAAALVRRGTCAATRSPRASELVDVAA